MVDSMASNGSPLATVAIQSIGDMGGGIARLLIANGYRVITNARGRSQATHERIKRLSIELVNDDEALCNSADYILSIVPPKDALANAKRIATATSKPAFKKRTSPLYFLDLNAISPESAREISNVFDEFSTDIRVMDGGIIGGPPKKVENGEWDVPSIPVSGPYQLSQSQPSGEHLAKVLHVKHVNETIGSATGLKICFAALSKGFTALAIQSFTTAHNLGVLYELKEHLESSNPRAARAVERGLPSMPPKAYRWVHEMEEIARTFESDGGFSQSESPFRAIARIYDLVANGTELGKELTDSRNRGKTAEDVVLLMSEGNAKRKVKTD
ncbi:Hypothetical protein R9X50_00059400 [Acrodontium crateriforme]|uniref:6-phosphogluconate dehydrogenase C-terminal domain-like protein n=1 Tax=Acrodontium crateriforme TaxID=150365 RepID=A0AAQ3LXK2_9PEZI|nr:Hypothetical protein R9X50_00059400 [Acrodontium crateriforme]